MTPKTDRLQQREGNRKSDDGDLDYDALSDETLMSRVRASRAIIEAQDNDPKLVMASFLDIFHPDMDDTLRRALIREV